MKKKTVLLIDDEVNTYMNYYIYALQEKDLEVISCPSVDEARVLLKEKQFDVIIIDVILPPGEWFKDTLTNEGLLTGKFLAEQAFLLQPQAKIVFLTNMPDLSLVEDMRRTAPFFQKIDNTPDSFAEQIVYMLNEE